MLLPHWNRKLVFGGNSATVVSVMVRKVKVFSPGALNGTVPLEGSVPMSSAAGLQNVLAELPPDMWAQVGDPLAIARKCLSFIDWLLHCLFGNMKHFSTNFESN